MERNKKTKVVEELGDKLSKIDSMFIAEYSGMTMAQLTRLRRELKNIGVEFNVVKNTLLSLASQGTAAERLKDKFTGPNAIVWIYEDPAGAARILQGFTKEAPQLKLKAGLLGNQEITRADIATLATLPGRQELIAKFLGLLQGVPQKFLNVLQGNVLKLLYTLEAIKTQKVEM